MCSVTSFYRSYLSEVYLLCMLWSRYATSEKIGLQLVWLVEFSSLLSLLAALLNVISIFHNSCNVTKQSNSISTFSCSDESEPSLRKRCNKWFAASHPDLISFFLKQNIKKLLLKDLENPKRNQRLSQEDLGKALCHKQKFPVWL